LGIKVHEEHAFALFGKGRRERGAARRLSYSPFLVRERENTGHWQSPRANAHTLSKLSILVTVASLGQCIALRDQPHSCDNNIARPAFRGATMISILRANFLTTAAVTDQPSPMLNSEVLAL
jgi:hypothetical protein